MSQCQVNNNNNKCWKASMWCLQEGSSWQLNLMSVLGGFIKDIVAFQEGWRVKRNVDFHCRRCLELSSFIVSYLHSSWAIFIHREVVQHLIDQWYFPIISEASFGHFIVKKVNTRSFRFGKLSLDLQSDFCFKAAWVGRARTDHQLRIEQSSPSR